MPSNIVSPPPKSQYEIERDERIARNEAFMKSIGIDPHGGGYVKKNTKKSPPKPRMPRKKVPESERRRSSRLQGVTLAPERLTYESDDDAPRRKRSRGSGGRSRKVARVESLSEEKPPMTVPPPDLGGGGPLVESLSSPELNVSICCFFRLPARPPACLFIFLRLGRLSFLATISVLHFD